MRWGAKGSSLVSRFGLCLNYFPSSGKELFRTCFENMGQAVTSRGVYFQATTMAIPSRQRKGEAESNNFLLSFIFNSAKGESYLTAGVC